MKNILDRVVSLLGKRDQEETQTMELGELRLVVLEAQHQEGKEIFSLHMKKDLEEKRKADSDVNAILEELIPQIAMCNA